MAVYERDRARIVIRVVYDGPGRAGKTTNVEQLARIFGNKPGNELQVYPAATGRTIFFDWFSFDGGMIDGHQLQVQVVTVPGHKSLEPRRAHILHTADVVVLVCDSAVSGQDSAREMLDSLREHLGKSATAVPLLVQANKQDLPGAMLPHELAAALGLTYDITVIGAQASAGIGVRETAIGAIRAAVRQMKRRTARQGLDALAGQAGTAEELRVTLQSLEAVGVGRGAGERRGPEDEARRAAPSGLGDDGRVVYIRSNSVATQLASGAGETQARARAGAARSVPSTMNDPPAGARPREQPRIPVAAMFIEPRRAHGPAEASFHIPPPPLLADSAVPASAAVELDAPAILAALAGPDEQADDAPAVVAADIAPSEVAASAPATLHALAQADAADEPAAHPAAAPASHELVWAPASTADSTAAALADASDTDSEADGGALSESEPAPGDEAPVTAPDVPEAAPHDLAEPAVPAEPEPTPADHSPEPTPHDLPEPVSFAEPTPHDLLEPAPFAEPTPPVAAEPEPPHHDFPEFAAFAGAEPTPPPHDLPEPAPFAEPTLPPSVAAEPTPPPHDLAAFAEPEPTPAVTAEPQPTHDLPEPVTAEPAPTPPVTAEPAPPHAPDLVAEVPPPVTEPAPVSAPSHLAPPGPDVPPGYVWPVPGGRAVLERIAGQSLVACASPEGHAPSDMSFQTPGFRLHARADRRFGERERGREALREHVRRVARLGPLLPSGIAVALAAEDDAAAVWHIVPDLPSLGDELRGTDEGERPRHLARLAAAYAAALRQVAREDIALELDPHAFAEQDGRYVYVDDRLREPEQGPSLARPLLSPWVGASDTLTDLWLAALEQALPAALTREDVAALDLERELEAAATGLAGEAEVQAARRVRATLDRCT